MTLSKIIKQDPGKDWDCLSANPNVNLEMIKNTLNKPWNWKSLSSNPSVTWDIVQKYPYKRWNWNKLSSNPIVTWDIIMAHPDRNGIGIIFPQILT